MNQLNFFRWFHSAWPYWRNSSVFLSIPHPLSFYPSLHSLQSAAYAIPFLASRSGTSTVDCCSARSAGFLRFFSSAASSHSNQALSPSSTAVCHPLCTTSAYFHLCGSISGIPTISSALAWVSPVSTPPQSSDPSDLHVAGHPNGSTRLPHPSGSTLVSCRQSAALWLHSSSFASSLCPSGSVRLTPQPPTLPSSSVTPAPPRSSGTTPPLYFWKGPVHTGSLKGNLPIKTVCVKGAFVLWHLFQRVLWRVIHCWFLWFFLVFSERQEHFFFSFFFEQEREITNDNIVIVSMRLNRERIETLVYSIAFAGYSPKIKTPIISHLNNNCKLCSDFPRY